MKTLKQFYALVLVLASVFSLVVPAFAAVEDTGFSDVDADAWYAEAVAYCREHGLMNGTSSAIAKCAPNSIIKEGLEVTYSSYDRTEISEWLTNSGVTAR